MGKYTTLTLFFVALCGCLSGCSSSSKGMVLNALQLRSHLSTSRGGWLYQGAGQFYPERLLLVDEVNGNYLFRGSFPAREGRIVYEEIDSLMRATAMLNGHVLPESYEFVLLSFMNHLVEAADLALERDYIARHHPSGEGRLFNFPVAEALLDPLSFPKPLRTCLAKNLAQTSLMPSRVERLRSLLAHSGERPRVVYAHCYRGLDRTGSVVAAYRMAYQRKSYEEVRREAKHVVARVAAWRPDINIFSLYSVRWYALYLREELDRHYIGKVEEMPPL